MKITFSGTVDEFITQLLNHIKDTRARAINEDRAARTQLEKGKAEGKLRALDEMESILTMIKFMEPPKPQQPAIPLPLTPGVVTSNERIDKHLYPWNFTYQDSNMKNHTSCEGYRTASEAETSMREFVKRINERYTS